MKKILLVAVPMFLSLAACESNKPAASKAPEVVRDVAIVQAASQQVPDAVTALGTVRAYESSQLAPQILGTVREVSVHEGDSVKQGQVLVSIDATQAQAELERAKAALSAAQHEVSVAKTDSDLSETTLKRYSVLYERKSVSPQEFDEMKARAASAHARAEAATSAEAQARAAVSQAETSFGYTRIRAPFDGVVTERRVDPGAMASPGNPILTIESSGRFRAEVTIDERSLRFAKLGEQVPISLDAYPAQQLSGKIAQIVPAADPQSRTFLVKIDLPHVPILRSGMSARASFAQGTRQALLVPKEAVVDRGSLKAVYVLDNDRVASLRFVTVAAPPGSNSFEILSGLAANEKVIAAPADREFAGKRIEVQ